MDKCKDGKMGGYMDGTGWGKSKDGYVKDTNTD